VNESLPISPDELKWRPTERVVDGLRYSVANSTLIVAHRYTDAGSFWRYVFRTPGGRFFLLAQRYDYPWSPHASNYVAHTGEIEPISQEYAVALWQRSSGDKLPFDQAFPGYEVQDA
jgi:hypothetical protein